MATETPQPILKPKHTSLTLAWLATSQEAFGVPFFQDLTGNWETRIKMRPVLQSIKKLGETALAQNRNWNRDLERFDDQGEDVITETYNLFRQNLKAAKMQDCFRVVITAMIDSTENYGKDKKHRIWLFKWLLSQARRNGVRSAKRKAKNIGTQDFDKRARAGTPKAIGLEESAATVRDFEASSSVVVEVAAPSRAQKKAHKKREYMTITDCMAHDIPQLASCYSTFVSLTDLIFLSSD
ncbi:hypothetical protein ABW21_db0207496 [Orbilia brochopaga]|nr:hypothetical protein ABW21_db0207496 [Drechslerella brochopaga]